MIGEQDKKAIDHWVAKFPEENKQSAVIAALTIVQESHGGYLTEPLMDSVAEYLDLPKIAVYEVASFYTLFDVKPVGRNKIYLCTNVSCMLCGSDAIADHLKKRLGVEFGGTSADGKFTLKEAECLAACDGAPMMQINKKTYTHLTTEKVDTILDQLKS